MIRNKKETNDNNSIISQNHWFHTFWVWRVGTGDQGERGGTGATGATGATGRADRCDGLVGKMHQITRSSLLFCSFLQRVVSIACYAERCISYSKSVRLSVCLSVTRWHWVKTTQATIMRSSLEDSPMPLVSSRLISPHNSKKNIGSEGAEWERGRKNRQFLANKSPYLRNGAR